MPFSHLPSAGHDPDEGLVPGWGADIHDNERRPGPVRRTDDHDVRSGRREYGAGSVMTEDGWKMVQPPPGRDGIFTSIWGEQNSAPAQAVRDAAYAAATDPDGLNVPPMPRAPAAAAGGVVEGDPPRERWNLLHLTNPWARRPAVAAVAVLLAIAGMVLAVVSVVLILKDALVAAWDGLCDSARVDARGWRRIVRLMWAGLVVGWRG